MPKCEQCNREFATQEGLDQHNQDKHAEGPTKHGLKQKKKQEKLMQKAEEKRKVSRSKWTKNIAMIGGVSFLLAVVVYALLFIMPSGNPGTSTDSTDLLSLNLREHSSMSLHIHP